MNLQITTDPEMQAVQTISVSSFNTSINTPNAQSREPINKRTFFRSVKKYNRHSHKRKKIKRETKEQKKVEKINDSNQHKYMNLLLNSFDKMMKSGIISMNYLNSKALPKLLLQSNYNLNEEEIEKNLIKCGNLICARNVENESLLNLAKFNQINSYKSENIYLCQKCYEAYEAENYCYYCNTIYRNFPFNEQYYDRKKWILCDCCERWQHMECEENYGIFKNIESLVSDKQFIYICPFCRNEKLFFNKHCKYYKGKYYFNFIYFF